MELKRKTIKILIALLVAALVVILAILISLIFKFNTLQSVVLSWILTAIYGFFAVLLVEPRIIQKIEVERIIEKPVETKVYEIVNKPFPVYIEKPVQIPMENKTIEVVEKQVPVYIEKPRKKLNIPKYKFLGSVKTRTFHKKTCRLGKLIKKKFKLSANKKIFFQKKHFKACKVCLKR